MFTVKLIDSMGDEYIYQTQHVSTKTNRETGLIQSLFFRDSSGDDLEFQGSHQVYVMNENGKTVAKYSMGTFIEAEREA